MTEPTTIKDEDAALSLTLAVVVAAHSPLILLDGELKLIAVSNSFCRAFDIDPEASRGRPVFAMGAGEWNAPDLHKLLKAALSGEAPADARLTLARPGKAPRQLVAHVEVLSYVDLKETRVLLAISDLTEALAADERTEELRQRNAMLVKEARHRVANSLQIIASVLLQHARRTQSEEARGQLSNAHHRVMSVAALERHLAGSDEEQVQVRPYLEKLCESIAASMIQAPDRVSLDVVADESVVDANVSVSLGLITTELVINSIKYAFPEGQAGRITVTYATVHGGWTLAVSDDGVGLPDEGTMATGLGASIVQALAMQLDALVILDRGRAGARISIVHPMPAEEAAVGG